MKLGYVIPTLLYQRIFRELGASIVVTFRHIVTHKGNESIANDIMSVWVLRKRSCELWAVAFTVAL